MSALHKKLCPHAIRSQEIRGVVMATTGMDNRARSGTVCSECNDLLVAPEWSAYVSNHEVLHVWFCENCGHEIEMAVNLRFDITSAKRKSLNPKH